MDNKIYISQLRKSLFFYKLLFEVNKIDVRLNKILTLNFILIFFDRVYLTHPSDTETRYTIYSPILLVERLFKWLSVLFCYFILWLAKSESRMIYIVLFEIEYSLEFISTNPPFFPVLSTLRFKQLLFGGSCSKNPRILKCKSFDVYFSICKSQDRAIIQPKFIDCLSDIFLNFVIAPYYLLV